MYLNVIYYFYLSNLCIPGLLFILHPPLSIINEFIAAFSIQYIIAGFYNQIMIVLINYSDLIIILYLRLFMVNYLIKY